MRQKLFLPVLTARMTTLPAFLADTTPVEDTVATWRLLLVHFTLEDAPAGRTRLTFSRSFPPRTISAVFLSSPIESAGVSFLYTTTVQDALTFLLYLLVAVMTALPALIPFTCPYLSTDAIFLLLDFHVTVFDAFAGVTDAAFKVTRFPISTLSRVAFSFSFVGFVTFAAAALAVNGTASASIHTVIKARKRFHLFLLITFPSCFSEICLSDYYVLIPAIIFTSFPV